MIWCCLIDRQYKDIIKQYIDKLNSVLKLVLLFSCIVYIFLFSLIDKNGLMISIISLFFFINLILIIFCLLYFGVLMKQLDDNKLFCCKNKIVSKLMDYDRYYVILGDIKVEIDKNLYNSCKSGDNIMIVTKEPYKNGRYKCFKL